MVLYIHIVLSCVFVYVYVHIWNDRASILFECQNSLSKTLAVWHSIIVMMMTKKKKKEEKKEGNKV